MAATWVGRADGSQAWQKLWVRRQAGGVEDGGIPMYVLGFLPSALSH